MVAGIAEDARDLRRRERELGEALRIGRPRHDVDALAVQLVDDRLHARPLESDAGADRIDRVVAREHGDLRAAADFAGGRADLDDVLLNLGDLELEERLDEERVATAQNESRTLGRFLDALEHGANRLALVIVLAVILLAIRNDRFRFAELVEHDDELAAFDLLHFAGEQVADARRELVANAGALALTNALNDSLLGGLHGGSPEHGEVDRLFHDVADLEAFVEGFGVVDGDLVARVLDGRDDRLQEDDANVALAVVDVDFGLNVRAVLLREGGENAVLEQCVQFRAIELLGVRHLAKRGENLCRTDHPDPSCYASSVRAERPPRAIRPIVAIYR